MLKKADNAAIRDGTSTDDQLVDMKQLFKPVDIALEPMFVESESENK